MDEEKIISEGKCLYCSKTISQQGFTRHIATHFKLMQAQMPSSQTALHIVVSAGSYFLHLLAPATTSLKTIDSFLRKIWLECCGHMSAFSNGRWGDDIGITRKLGDAFNMKNKIVYRYDFGSTTELQVEVKGAYKIATAGILLISRNEPLAIMCNSCQQEPATTICAVHVYDEGEGWYCNNCAAGHEKVCEDFADYAKMPVVNSPRTGECAYDGGSVDIERDGVYKNKQN